MKKLNLAKQSTGLFDFVSIMFSVKETFINDFIKKYTVTYIHLFWFIFSTTHTVKVNYSQILLPGKIDYNLYHPKYLKINSQNI